MKATIFDIRVKSFAEEINISPFSDIHLDSPECDIRKMHKCAKSRAALPNSIFIGVGDMFNAVLPGDVKRYQATCLKPGAYQKDNLLDHMVKDALKELGGYPWVLVGQGNHEHSIEKAHYVNLNQRFAESVKLPSFVQRVATERSDVKCTNGGDACVDGTYSGFIRLRLWDANRKVGNGPRASIDIAYHHGAWGGQGGGIIGARRWANTMQGARLYLFGHNHRSLVDPFSVFHLNQAGRIVEEPAYVVMCGTYLNTFSDNSTTYSEKGGFPPISTGTPLITLKVDQSRDKGAQNGAKVGVRISLGD